ncbi:MAG: DinB family protein [Sporichthyaceae bacterium]
MPDQPTPFFEADEIGTLIGFLDYLRGCVVAKVQGLADDDAAKPIVPSGTSLSGLIKHLTNVERFWVQHMWAGHDDVPLQRDHWTVDQGLTALIADYEAACSRNNEVVAADALPDRQCARAWNGEVLTLRWVLVHLVEETSRHAGHADLLRELIDGEVGR